MNSLLGPATQIEKSIMAPTPCSGGAHFWRINYTENPEAKIADGTLCICGEKKYKKRPWRSLPHDELFKSGLGLREAAEMRSNEFNPDWVTTPGSHLREYIECEPDFKFEDMPVSFWENLNRNYFEGFFAGKRVV